MQAARQQLDFRQYVAVLGRRRLWILLPAIAATVVSLGMASIESEVYQARSQVRIESEEIDTEVALITAQSVSDAVEEALGDRADDVLSVRATRLEETQLVSITVRGTSPTVAAEAADLYATQYAEAKNVAASEVLVEEQQRLEEAAAALSPRIVELQETIATLEDEPADERDLSALATARSELSQLESQQRDLNDRAAALQFEASAATDVVSIPNPATVPGSPVSPKPVRSAVTGLAAGLLLGLGVAALAEMADDRIKDDVDVQRWVSGVPVVASIPVVSRKALGGGLPSLEQAYGEASEAYRILRTSLQFLRAGRELHSVLITSTTPGEGKTTTACNLAITLAQTEREVMLIDADFRNASVAAAFDISDATGLSSVVLRQKSIERATTKVRVPSGELTVMPAGPLPPNPAEVVELAAVSELLAELQQEWFVVLDSPPILPVSDSISLAKRVDATLVVVRVNVTRGRALARAVERLAAAGVPVAGIVLNADPTQTVFGYGQVGDVSRREPMVPVAAGRRARRSR